MAGIGDLAITFIKQLMLRKKRYKLPHTPVFLTM